MRPVLEPERMGAALAAVPLIAAKGDNLAGSRRSVWR
jgi:hypothetical protein